MSREGRVSCFHRGPANGRNRRVSPIAPRPREGPLIEPTADARPGPRERVLMPHTCRSQLDKIGRKAQDTAELFFDDVRVPADNLLGGVEGQGFYQLMHDLPYERMMIGVGAMAAMEGAYRATLDYVRDRQAFGRPIADFQNTRFKLAEVATQIMVGRAFIDRCVEQLLAGALDTATASMAKLWASETEGRVIDELLQQHGGYGYMNEFMIARMYADARVARIYGGTNEIMKEVIARAL